MGAELWTSPITGHRRRGTRLLELRSILLRGIVTGAILEPILSCPAHALASEMGAILTRRGFDVAGVMKDEKGPVIGFVTAKALTSGTVLDQMQALTSDQLMADTTPLELLLESLASRQYSFVLTANRVSGIVTRADLNKPPVRVYFFSLISLLEMHIGFWVRHSYANDSWENHIDRKQRAKAIKLQDQRRKRNQDMNLFDCLQFAVKRDLFLRERELIKNLGFVSKRKAERFLKHAEDLRNLLAHSHQDLTQGSTWEEIINLISSIETFVQTSDEAIEKQAKKSSHGYSDGLLSSI